MWLVACGHENECDARSCVSPQDSRSQHSAHSFTCVWVKVRLLWILYETLGSSFTFKLLTII